MEDNRPNQDIASLLARNWDLDLPAGPDLKAIEAALSARLAELIDHDFERLVQAMYRMDVDEGKFATAMACSSVNERAAALAHIVLQRELQRLEFRKRYQSGGFEQT